MKLIVTMQITDVFRRKSNCRNGGFCACCDHQGHKFNCAYAVKKILGYEAEDLERKSIKTICHPSDVTTILRELKQPSNDNEQMNFIYRARKRRQRLYPDGMIREIAQQGWKRSEIHCTFPSRTTSLWIIKDGSRASTATAQRIVR